MFLPGIRQYAITIKLKLWHCIWILQISQFNNLCWYILVYYTTCKYSISPSVWLGQLVISESSRSSLLSLILTIQWYMFVSLVELVSIQRHVITHRSFYNQLPREGNQLRKMWTANEKQFTTSSWCTIYIYQIVFEQHIITIISCGQWNILVTPLRILTI